MVAGSLRASPKRWVAWAVVALAALILAWAPFPSPAQAASERTIRIEARSFAYTPGTLRVNPGDRVTLELVSMDVVHGLYLEGYNLNLRADPGQTARITFTADRSGTFRFQCSVTCGALHPFMIGKLTVGSSSLWMRAAGLSLLAALAGFLLWRR
jgi:heme/copper-type cytochrome/quinol oxidase subunit 2